MSFDFFRLLLSVNRRLAFRSLLVSCPVRLWPNRLANHAINASSSTKPASLLLHSSDILLVDPILPNPAHMGVSFQSSWPAPLLSAHPETSPLLLLHSAYTLS